MMLSVDEFIIYMHVMCVTLNESDVIKSEHRYHLMCVWPCIIYENDESYQLDATIVIYEGWNFNSGNYLFTNDTK